jgi:hypothetical protein
MAAADQVFRIKQKEGKTAGISIAYLLDARLPRMLAPGL